MLFPLLEILKIFLLNLLTSRSGCEGEHTQPIKMKKDMETQVRTDNKQQTERRVLEHNLFTYFLNKDSSYEHIGG